MECDARISVMPTGTRRGMQESRPVSLCCIDVGTMFEQKVDDRKTCYNQVLIILRNTDYV
jgi:hypothetical protein